MTPSALADRIAALDWSGVSLQHQLAVTAAVETLRNGPNFKGLENDSLRDSVEAAERQMDVENRSRYPGANSIRVDALHCGDGAPASGREAMSAVRQDRGRDSNGDYAVHASDAVVLPFRLPSPELLRNSACTERRVTLRRPDGTTAATATLARSERWDWIVETVCSLVDCDPEAVAMVDDTVTVDGLPVFSC
jgi:hypothetical protein